MNNKGLCFYAKVLPHTIFVYSDKNQGYGMMGNVGLIILIKKEDIPHKIKNWIRTSFTNFIFSDYHYVKEDIRNVCTTYLKQIKEEYNLLNSGFEMDYNPETNEINGCFYIQLQKHLDYTNINFRIIKEL